MNPNYYISEQEYDTFLERAERYYEVNKVLSGVTGQVIRHTDQFDYYCMLVSREPLMKEIERLRSLLIMAAGNVPHYPGWPEEEWKRAEMAIQQRNSWKNQDKD